MKILCHNSVLCFFSGFSSSHRAEHQAVKQYTLSIQPWSISRMVLFVFSSESDNQKPTNVTNFIRGLYWGGYLHIAPAFVLLWSYHYYISYWSFVLCVFCVYIRVNELALCIFYKNGMFFCFCFFHSSLLFVPFCWRYIK